MPTWLLAVLIAYLHFFTAMTDKQKKPGKENILSKKELIVKKLSPEPKPTTMKFTRKVPREFVEYNFHGSHQSWKVLESSGI